MAVARGVDADADSVGAIAGRERVVVAWGPRESGREQDAGAVAARVLRRRSGRAEACDQRSGPQDVTSSWARRGGVNLQQEVEPQQTERPPRDSPAEDTPDVNVGSGIEHTSRRGGHHGFRRRTASPARPAAELSVSRLFRRAIEHADGHQGDGALYAVAGAVPAWQWLYATLFTGVTDKSPDPLNALILLGLAYGLATFRQWARILGLLVAALFGFVGIVGLVLCFGHVLGIHRAAGGTILDRPATTFGILAALVAFAGWQWWLLGRPESRDLFGRGIG